MSFNLQTISLFTGNVKIYKSFLSSVFEIDFEDEGNTFELNGSRFEIINLTGYKAPLKHSFVLTCSDSKEDVLARIELFNYKNSSNKISHLLEQNAFYLVDFSNVNWKIEFITQV